MALFSIVQLQTDTQNTQNNDETFSSSQTAPQANKRQFKNEKFGYGGKKKGGKSNTKQSTDDVSGYKAFRSNNPKQKGKRSFVANKKFGKTKRPGKDKRQKLKSKKK